MNALSLFSGCGGLDLAAEMAGIRVLGQCEIDRHCNRVLSKHWPDVYRWEDIQNVTGTDVHERLGQIDLVFGGPPCQPVSVAGRRKASGDSRNMWPEFLRVIREVSPEWVVAENPTGILSCPRKPGEEKGTFFGDIIREMAALGYVVGHGVWSACDVGAPHKRERVFIVAHRDSVGHPDWGRGLGEEMGRRRNASYNSTTTKDGLPLAHRDGERESQPSRVLSESRGWSGDGSSGLADTSDEHLNGAVSPWGGRTGLADSGVVADSTCQQDRRIFQPRVPSDAGAGSVVGDTGSAGCQEHDAPSVASDARHTSGQCACEKLGDAERCGRCGEPWGRSGAEPEDRHTRGGRCAQSGVGRVSDGLSHGLDGHLWPAGRGAEQYPWEPPRVVPGKSCPGRSQRIKMLGNAVVPAQAYSLFAAIMEGGTSPCL